MTMCKVDGTGQHVACSNNESLLKQKYFLQSLILIKKFKTAELEFVNCQSYTDKLCQYQSQPVQEP